MTLSALPLTDLLAAFRSAAPTPGGGSAAALAGAVGSSLAAMVAGLPKARSSDPADLARLSGAGTRCTALADTLASLVDRDAEAYNGVMAAFKLPKSTDEEKAARSARIQEATRHATETPLDVMRGCHAALGEARTIAPLGNPNASSDLQVALELLRAAVRGAGFNVEINLGSLKDAEYVARTRDEIARLRKEADEAASAAAASLAG
jgi:formiminotetrahydrofolate cyclodeaminase